MAPRSAESDSHSRDLPILLHESPDRCRRHRTCARAFLRSLAGSKHTSLTNSTTHCHPQLLLLYGQYFQSTFSKNTLLLMAATSNPALGLQVSCLVDRIGSASLLLELLRDVLEKKNSDMPEPDDGIGVYVRMVPFGILNRSCHIQSLPGFFL